MYTMFSRLFASGRKVCPLVALAEEAVIAAFQVQQVCFGVESACKPRKLPGRTDDAMTWRNDGNRVSAVCRADGPCRTWISELIGELAVGSGFSVRDPK